MPHLRLGNILVNQGLVSQDQLDRALVIGQKDNQKLIGEILVEEGVVTEDIVAFALGMQFSLPVYSSDNLGMLTPNSEQELKEIISFDFSKKNIVLPLVLHGNILTCAVADPLNLVMLDQLRQTTGCDINLVIATKKGIISAITEFYCEGEESINIMVKEDSVIDKTMRDSYGERNKDHSRIRDDNLGKDKDAINLNNLIKKSKDKILMKIVDLIISQAIDSRASDIHIEPFEDKISLRYRIDGKLYDILPPTTDLHTLIVVRVKAIAHLNMIETDVPQNGMFIVKIQDKDINIRVATIPTVWGEKVVMRIFNNDLMPFDLLSLGLLQNKIDMIRKVLSASKGLVYVTGSTGSGKSTTLYSMINEMRDTSKNIITCEDPVEYTMDGVSQVAVCSEMGLNFATFLKSFSYQDPDVIMLSHTFDFETASNCVHAALSGHFVLSALHCSNTVSALAYLRDIGIQDFLLKDSLSMIIGQCLVRRLCVECKEAYEPTLNEECDQTFKVDLIYSAKGCEVCKYTGYEGQIMIAEILFIDETIRSCIAKGAKHSQIYNEARKNGMETIYENGISLVEKGVTSFEEVCHLNK